jgi:hypothetical protein
MHTTVSGDRKAHHFKERAAEEFRLYWVVFAFMALMFCAFVTYRRLVLEEAGISYEHWGAGLIKAAIIAKVILVGQAMKVGRRIENHPLIISVLVKAVLYGLLVAVFNVLERVIEGLIHGSGWQAIAHRVVMNGPNEIVADSLMVLVAFIPFFALWETGRVLGPGTLAELFLRRTPVGNAPRVH